MLRKCLKIGQALEVLYNSILYTPKVLNIRHHFKIKLVDYCSLQPVTVSHL